MQHHKERLRKILTVFRNMVKGSLNTPLVSGVAAVGNDAGPPAVMTTQLPRLS